MAAALNLRWLVNSPFFSVTVDLQKNMINRTLYNTPKSLCVEHHDADTGITYEDCEIVTATDVTFSFVLTSIEKTISSNRAAAGSVPLTRGHYSLTVLESLQAVFSEEEKKEGGDPFAALLNQIHTAIPYTSSGDGEVDVGRDSLMTVVKTAELQDIQSCGGGSGVSTAAGYALTYLDSNATSTTTAASTGRQSEDKLHLDISKRVIDSKYVSLPP